MSATKLVHALAGLWIVLKHPPARDQRGISQSVEVALLVAAAAVVATLIVVAVRTFVQNEISDLG